MDSNPYAFNRDVSYPTCAGFPRNMTCKDLLEAHIQVVVPGKASGRGDFTANVEDIFSKYRLPHISSETVVGLWQTNPMGFWQNQVNFAVWCSTTGCGVSWRDHLDIDRPLARSVFRFHTYYQVRRILDELQVPLPQDQAWDPFQNPYDRRAYERLCREFGVDPTTDWRQKDSNSGGLGTVYQYNHGYQPKGSWNRNRMRFQPDSSLSQTAAFGRESTSTTSHRVLRQMRLGPPSSSIRARDLLRPVWSGWTTASGLTCGPFLAPRPRPAQQSLEQAPASMLRSSSWQTLRMQYRPLWTSRQPSSATRVCSRMRAQKWITPSALASTWRRATCGSISALFLAITTTSWSPQSGSLSESPPTLTALQCQPLLRLEKQGWWCLKPTTSLTPPVSRPLRLLPPLFRLSRHKKRRITRMKKWPLSPPELR